MPRPSTHDLNGRGGGRRVADGHSFDPLEEGKFLTPVARGLANGVRPQWLGTEFRVGNRVFKLAGEAGYRQQSTGGPAIHFAYDADKKGGGGLLCLRRSPNTLKQKRCASRQSTMLAQK